MNDLRRILGDGAPERSDKYVAYQAHALQPPEEGEVLGVVDQDAKRRFLCIVSGHLAATLRTILAEPYMKIRWSIDLASLCHAQFLHMKEECGGQYVQI